MGNNCLKEDVSKEKKNQTTLKSSLKNSKNQNKLDNEKGNVSIEKKPKTQIPIQGSAATEAKKGMNFINDAERQKGKQNKIKQPTDEIQRIYFQICGQDQYMNDQKLFDFLGNYLKIADDDIVSGHITTNIMELTKIQKTPLQNFRKLFKFCNATNLNGVKQRLPALRQSLQNKDIFQKTYLKVFTIYTGDHSTLDLETAAQLWYVYLKGKLKWHKQLSEYIEGKTDKQAIKVHKDLWKMMLSFSLEIKDIQRDYKEDDFWPTFIENFVQFIQEKK